MVESAVCWPSSPASVPRDIVLFDETPAVSRRPDECPLLRMRGQAQNARSCARRRAMAPRGAVIGGLASGLAAVLADALATNSTSESTWYR